MSNRSPRGYYHICKQMKILKKKLPDLEFLTHKEHKRQKQSQRNVLQKEFTFESSLAKGLHIYARMNYRADVFHCSSTVDEQLFFRTPSSG